MSVVPSFDTPYLYTDASFSQGLYFPVEDFGVSAKIDPTMTYKGTLPKSGKAFTFGPLRDKSAVQHMLDLQDAVRQEAKKKGTEHFLISRTKKEFEDTIDSPDSFYGAWSDGKLVAMFKLGKHDDEKSDGRGKTTPKAQLDVKHYKQVMILGAAQVHPDYADEGIGLLGTLFRHQEFLDSKRDVMMTKIHDDNKGVQKRYRDAGFKLVFSTWIKSGILRTFKANRATIQNWVDDNTEKAFKRFDLQPQKTDYRYN